MSSNTKDILQLTSDKLDTLDSLTSWKKVGSGAYSTVYKSKHQLNINGYTGFWVKKKLKGKSDSLDMTITDKRRFMQKWKLINKLPCYFISGGSILVPYLGKVEPNDTETAGAVLRMYQEHGIIIADAPSKGNFLLHNGKVYCVDYDHGYTVGSLASEIAYVRMIKRGAFDEYWDHPANQRLRPKTIKFIRALLFLEYNYLLSFEQRKALTPNMLETVARDLDMLKSQAIEERVAYIEKELFTPNSVPYEPKDSAIIIERVKREQLNSKYYEDILFIHRITPIPPELFKRFDEDFLKAVRTARDAGEFNASPTKKSLLLTQLMQEHGILFVEEDAETATVTEGEQATPSDSKKPGHTIGYVNLSKTSLPFTLQIAWWGGTENGKDAKSRDILDTLNGKFINSETVINLLKVLATPREHGFFTATFAKTHSIGQLYKRVIAVNDSMTDFSQLKVIKLKLIDLLGLEALNSLAKFEDSVSDLLLNKIKLTGIVNYQDKPAKTV